MRDLVRRVIAVLLLTVAIGIGLAASAGAGAWCLNLRPGSPIHPLKVCLPTNY